MLRFALWARWLLFPAGLLLAVWLLVDLTGTQELDSVDVPWTFVAVAFALNLAYVLAYSLMWHAVTLVHGVQIALPAGAATYLYANVGKYLPFKIAGMALRIAIYSQRFERDAVLTTKAVYVETLTNPLLQLIDVEQIVRFAKEHNLVSLIDNTFASPVNFRPADWGFDLTLESATKYLNGHSDIVAGAVTGSKELIRSIKHRLDHLGGSLDPHACFLLQRGLKTLAIRVRYQCESAMRIASFLADHPAVQALPRGAL